MASPIPTREPDPRPLLENLERAILAWHRARQAHPQQGGYSPYNQRLEALGQVPDAARPVVDALTKVLEVGSCGPCLS
jgi:hypothetical protein